MMVLFCSFFFLLFFSSRFISKVRMLASTSQHPSSDQLKRRGRVSSFYTSRSLVNLSGLSGAYLVCMLFATLYFSQQSQPGPVPS